MRSVRPPLSGSLGYGPCQSKGRKRGGRGGRGPKKPAFSNPPSRRELRGQNEGRERGLGAAIFIDGGYFLTHIATERAQIDYARLANFLLTPLRRNLPIDLLRSYFYYCAPWMPEHPGPDELRRMEAHRSFVDQIESTNRWQVRLGKLE